MSIKTDLKNSTSSRGYTLAEILIVLVIIGVISVMVLPTVNVSVKERKLTTAAQVERTKIIEAVDSLSAVDRAGNHANTAAFVDALREHLKIIKVCSTNNLTDCWGYDNITLDNGTYSISEAANGESTFGMNGTDLRGRAADYSSSNVGIVLADGTPVVISYNKKCRKDGTEIKNCFAAVFDSNGKSLPNKLGEDVILINAKSFGVVQEPVAAAAKDNAQVEDEDAVTDMDVQQNQPGVPSQNWDSDVWKNSGTVTSSSDSQDQLEVAGTPGVKGQVFTDDASDYITETAGNSGSRDGSKFTNDGNDSSETAGNTGGKDGSGPFWDYINDGPEEE